MLSDSFAFLLMSPSNGVTLYVDGLPVDLSRRITPISGALSGLHLPASDPASHHGPLTLTLIYSEN